MNHDTSVANIACISFAEMCTTYCGSHTAKSIHSDLTKIKSLKCKVIQLHNVGYLSMYICVCSQCLPPCKAQTSDDYIKRAKR